MCRLTRLLPHHINQAKDQALGPEAAAAVTGVSLASVRRSQTAAEGGAWSSGVGGNPQTLTVGDLNPAIAERLRQLIEDTVNYLRWTLLWPSVVQAIRSIRFGDLPSDVPYTPRWPGRARFQAAVYSVMRNIRSGAVEPPALTTVADPAAAASASAAAVASAADGAVLGLQRQRSTVVSSARRLRLGNGLVLPQWHHRRRPW